MVTVAYFFEDRSFSKYNKIIKTKKKIKKFFLKNAQKFRTILQNVYYGKKSRAFLI